MPSTERRPERMHSVRPVPSKITSKTSSASESAMLAAVGE